MRSFKERVNKIEDQLVKNPNVGSPLGISWLREKRYGKYRIYYIIYEDLKSVFMVAISEKKDQQKVINTVKILLEYFKEEIKELVDKNKIT
ncbi:MAG: hypothetical protein HYU56_03830 [Candidatus Aenigmarchaeota archaeon]|nr:hypothetical protein [Candidatus Aenigmarchaeota archaeon]